MQYSIRTNVILLMKERLLTIILLSCVSIAVNAQERVVENRPYCDLRPFHFGVLIGTHFQDIELQNAGPQQVINEDGSETEKLISCEHDRWDAGFTVGVLGETRLGTYFAFRLAPAMYFGNKHLSFLNHSDMLEDGRPIKVEQDMKMIYISTAASIIYSAQRFNNHRPYIVAGVNPMLNLSGKDNDYIKLKPFDCFLEVGMGCDFYLPFFKLRPELKFSYSLVNTLDNNHVNELKDRNMVMYTNSVVNKTRTKMISLTFYFE